MKLFALITAFSALTTLWVGGSLGVFLLILWCCCVFAYCLDRSAT